MLLSDQNSQSLCPKELWIMQSGISRSETRLGSKMCIHVRLRLNQQRREVCPCGCLLLLGGSVLLDLFAQFSPVADGGDAELDKVSVLQGCQRICVNTLPPELGGMQFVSYSGGGECEFCNDGLSESNLSSPNSRRKETAQADKVHKQDNTPSK